MDIAKKIEKSALHQYIKEQGLSSLNWVSLGDDHITTDLVDGVHLCACDHSDGQPCVYVAFSIRDLLWDDNGRTGADALPYLEAHFHKAPEAREAHRVLTLILNPTR